MCAFFSEKHQTRTGVAWMALERLGVDRWGSLLKPGLDLSLHRAQWKNRCPCSYVCIASPGARHSCWRFVVAALVVVAVGGGSGRANCTSRVVLVVSFVLVLFLPHRSRGSSSDDITSE